MFDAMQAASGHNALRCMHAPVLFLLLLLLPAALAQQCGNAGEQCCPDGIIINGEPFHCAAGLACHQGTCVSCGGLNMAPCPEDGTVLALPPSSWHSLQSLHSLQP